MIAIQYTAHGGVEQLKIAALADPEPEPGEVRIAVRACALNGFDPMMLAGATGLKVPLPMIPCGDVAGVVEQLGDGVARDWLGRAVSVYPMLPTRGMLGEVTPGAAAQRLCVPATALIPIPAPVDMVAAAALPVAYGTALRMLVTRGALAAGERVLILGAAGGVGIACVQIAQMLGAEVVACARGAAKAERLRALGATHVIDTATTDVRSAVVARFGKPSYVSGAGGVDVLVNYLGGETWIDALRCVRRDGRILVCGATLGHAPANDLRYLWSFEHRIIGSNGWTPDDQRQLLEWVASGQLRPEIHEVAPLAELPRLMQALIERAVIGKAVLCP